MEAIKNVVITKEVEVVFKILGTHGHRQVRQALLITGNHITVGLATLGNRINHASVWQTYKINNVTINWYYAGADPIFSTTELASAENIGDLVVAICPFSWDPFLSSTTLQSFDIRSIPGCQLKYFNARLYYPRMYTEGEQNTTTGIQAAASYYQTQPQMLKVLNECPMYNMQSVSEVGMQSGQVYSNNKLALLSAHGRDTNLWHSFLTQIHTFDTINRLTTIRENIIMRVNITFEGLRWEASNLFLDSRPSCKSLCDNLQAQQHTTGRDWRDSEEASECASSSDRSPRRKRQKDLSPHYHCYLRFRSKQNPSAVRKMFPC